jgi:hypothetical protein
MAETEKAATAPAQPAKAKPTKKDTPVPETEVVNGYTLKHLGHGKYKIEGQSKEFPTRAAAVSYIDDLKSVADYESKFGDVVPDGVEIFSNTLEYRGTLTELPMNEQYLPDGGYNGFYDRAWHWGWGRATGPDVSQKQARGWRVITRDELEEAIKEGQVPEHYGSFLLSVDHGNRMQYGDLVLMRIPRVRWRQQRVEDEKAAMARIKRQDEQSHEVFERAGVKNVNGPITNEVSTGLKISGF